MGMARRPIQRGGAVEPGNCESKAFVRRFVVTPCCVLLVEHAGCLSEPPIAPIADGGIAYCGQYALWCNRAGGSCQATAHPVY